VRRGEVEDEEESPIYQAFLVFLIFFSYPPALLPTTLLKLPSGYPLRLPFFLYTSFTSSALSIVLLFLLFLRDIRGR